MGAFTGALSAGIFNAAGGVISSMGLLKGVEAGSASAIAEASAIHFIAGAASGAISSALSGGHIGLNALESGVSAGVAYGAGAELGMMPGSKTGWLSELNTDEKFVAGIAFHTTVGSLTGGVTAELAGGRFVQGMGQGAWTAAYGFIFNEAAHAAESFILKNVHVTGYCNCNICTLKSFGDPGYGIAADGTVAGPGTVAVDPRLIPYGSQITFNQPDGQVFNGVAHDTGGAIGGNHIDIWCPSHSQAFTVNYTVDQITVTPPH